MRAREVRDGKVLCPGCGAWLAEDAFGRRKSGRLNSYCRECARRRAQRWYETNHERGLATRATYREEHRGELSDYFRRYATENADRRRAQNKEWQAKNADRVKAGARDRYERTRATRIAQAAAWARANPEKARQHTRAKNVRRRGAPLDAEARAYVQLLERDPCSYCGGRLEIVIDHITALATGGNSQADNLTAACRSCNAAKSDRPLLTFMWERRPA